MNNNNKFIVPVENGTIRDYKSIHDISILWTVYFINYWERMIDRILYMRYGWKVTFDFKCEVTVIIDEEVTTKVLFDQNISPKSFFYTLRSCDRSLNNYLSYLDFESCDIEVKTFTFDFKIREYVN